MFDELKPCPFCGGQAHLFVNDQKRQAGVLKNEFA